MNTRDLILLLLSAGSDRVARANACRVLAVEFPMMTWEPGEGKTLVIGRSGPHMMPRIMEITLRDPEEETLS